MNQTISCNQCGNLIDINESLYTKLEQEAQKKFEVQIETERLKYETLQKNLQTKEKTLQEQQENLDEMVATATKEHLKQERLKLYDAIKKELVEEQSESIALLQQEITEKSKQLQQLNAFKVEIEKLKREKEEASAQAKVEAQLALTQELKLEKEKLQKQLQTENELKLKAKDEQIEQMKRDIENAKRKAEQSSMQIQGETQELLIEEWLTTQFPFDTIDEIKKGAYGADCIQTVHTRAAQNCGILCYESKNTKAWNNDWIPKLKQDMLQAKADIGVLVTSVFPVNMSRMGFVDGIWVCSLEEFKGSVALLRDSLIRVHHTLQKEENKSDKMSLLYTYLTSNEFSMQLSAIVEGFITLQSELNKEKRSIMSSWKRRQKLIDGVLTNTTEMYGSLQGIAGNQLVHIEELELEESEEKKLLE